MGLEPPEPLGECMEHTQSCPTGWGTWGAYSSNPHWLTGLGWGPECLVSVTSGLFCLPNRLSPCGGEAGGLRIAGELSAVA